MKQIKTLLIAAILTLGASQTINAQAKTAHVDVTEIMLDGRLPLPKQKLFSKNRYVRFGKIVSILNENSGIESIELAGRNINVIFDITDVHIGAFKGIYSIKPEALIIPGLIPDFSKFFMEQNLTDLNENTTPLINNSIGTIDNIFR